MKIEVWSDIACPFCYIGKHHFETALAAFAHKEEIKVVYKSFQLTPDYYFSEGDTVYKHLSEKKGMPMEQVKQMTAHVTNTAKEAGLAIDFETNIPANTFDAHRLIQLGNKEGCGKQVVEQLFEAHFSKGKNIENKEELIAIGVDSGIEIVKIEQMLSSEDFAYEVKQDILESRNIGVQGVPFFLLMGKYAVSGAQPVEAFAEALSKSYSAWKKENNGIVNLNTTDSDSCSEEGCSL